MRTTIIVCLLLMNAVRTSVAAELESPAKTCNVAILWGNPQVSRLELSSWFSYLQFRAVQMPKPRDCKVDVEIVQPQFEEEVLARERVVLAYKTLK